MNEYRKIPVLIFLILATTLVSCKVELFTNISEKEANEMKAILMEEGIGSDKIAGKENTWTLRVAEKNFARAVEKLKNLGYPRNRFVSIGDVFQKKGLVSSPLEERIRFIYALSSEISETISQIDGVIAARVHVVIPENDPLNDAVKPSSAAVFIKHRSTANIAASIPQIKKLVINSIEGLTYEKVSLVLLPSRPALKPVAEIKTADILGIRVALESVTRLWLLIGGLVLLAAVALAFLGYVVWDSRKKERALVKIGDE